jgi:hypothetical protein
MPAGPNRPEPLVLDEVLVVGRHPNHPYLDIVLVGTNGSDEVWQTAMQYVDALSSAGAWGTKDPGAVLVDVRNNNVRVAKALRRMR